MHSSLNETNHRPWPLPKRAWQWRQTWSSLAFLHYRVAADSLAGQIPGGLALETFDGSAWVSVVPFQMEDVAPRNLPAPPPLKSFLELNLRTYVTDGEKSGVWFFSLDANCMPFVLGGRALYNLPYYRAGIQHQVADGVHTFTSRRWAKGAGFAAQYGACSPVFQAAAGSFEHWITERYCLYAARRGRVNRIEVHHPAWPLQQAEVEVRECSLFAAVGIRVEDAPPVCHYSAGVKVISYAPERVEANHN